MKYFYIGIAVVVVAIIIYVISTYNTFVTYQNKISEAFSTMDIYLVKRSGLIPNIIATVKGYAKYEADTLERVVNARNKAVNASSNLEKIEANQDLTSAISKLFALAESYPDLKANNNFMDLQQSLKSIEAEIASARKYYNGVVRQFNTMLQTIPSCFVAKMMHLQAQPLYQVADEKQRENVKVEF